MSRSRAVNRSNRFNAKQRRKTLRSEIPGFQDALQRESNDFDHSKNLLRKTKEKEIWSDLMEPKLPVSP